MKVSQYKRKDPFLLCEIFDGRKVHMFIPLSFKQMTLCHQVVAQEGYTDDGTRQLCKTCMRQADVKYGRKAAVVNGHARP